MTTTTARRTLLAVGGSAAIAGACLFPGTASASTTAPASTASHSPTAQTFVMMFRSVDGVDKTTTVDAYGPIQARGTETQTDGTDGARTAVLHFRGGTLTLAIAEEFSTTPDLATCTALGSGQGTWNIVAGSGRYAHTTGSGSFTVSDYVIGARDHSGTCLGSAAPPSLSIGPVVATGTITNR